MRIISMTFAAAFVAATALAGIDAANACGCAKRHMIEKYGTVSSIQQLPPAPPKKPAPAPSSEKNG
jgi:hypothetical protein